MTGGQDWAAEHISTGGEGMSEIQRYSVPYLPTSFHFDNHGEWVRYADHVAECDRLKKANETLVRGIDNLRADNRKLRADCDRLREIIDQRNRLYDAERMKRADTEVENGRLQAEVERWKEETERLLAYGERVKDLLKSFGCTVDHQGNVTGCQSQGQPKHIPYTLETWPKTLTAVWNGSRCFQIVSVVPEGVIAVSLTGGHSEPISFRPIAIGHDTLLATGYTKPDGSPCGQEVEG